MTQREIKSIKQLEKLLIDIKLDGFITALDRSKDHETYPKAHIYKGTFDNPETPMCNKAPQSFWRNNVNKNGICKVCLKNTFNLLTTNNK